MAVYVDKKKYPIRGSRGRVMYMCHMLADTEEELHAMADAIGVARKHFQNAPGKTPHYDICQAKKEMALQRGAIEIGFRKTVEIIRAWRDKKEGADH